MGSGKNRGFALKQGETGPYTLFKESEFSEEHPAAGVELVPVYVGSLQMALATLQHCVSRTAVQHAVVVEAHNIPCKQKLVRVINYIMSRLKSRDTTSSAPIDTIQMD